MFLTEHESRSFRLILKHVRSAYRPNSTVFSGACYDARWIIVSPMVDENIFTGRNIEGTRCKNCLLMRWTIVAFARSHIQKNTLLRGKGPPKSAM